MVTALILVMGVIRHSLIRAVLSNINACIVVNALMFEMFVTREPG
jgi:hypothetical protein